jgi:hypothetical protein
LHIFNRCRDGLEDRGQGIQGEKFLLDAVRSEDQGLRRAAHCRIGNQHPKQRLNLDQLVCNLSDLRGRKEQKRIVDEERSFGGIIGRLEQRRLLFQFASKQRAGFAGQFRRRGIDYGQNRRSALDEHAAGQFTLTPERITCK